mmetsp:Transcript_15326/g.23594  ORF Transcript_15326/g.23594 Transcript_15326/m.23594 type:complete len:90 (-) Transcript_15326:1054-1323(-)|eukprot:CAMPEP_0170513504 /NCGR_PEP_ID=MMETSP0208-20121228/67434_1 /TAXON_ID=197538 /ORGANISM="Strombidium inclinatum, Strain S3" /LENGTH=89 /DNA_ID=CAMNT_0010797237 /DNA_START=1162 /DNA_END=1431 /DNA_ORIENTATION=-
MIVKLRQAQHQKQVALLYQSMNKSKLKEQPDEEAVERGGSSNALDTFHTGHMMSIKQKEEEVKKQQASKTPSPEPLHAQSTLQAKQKKN